ncbi:MAG: hypothetical protein K9M81_02910 [Chthoniobacterales bacterium]|nr:hypothetical protein [Chthoniobacterales bacterium]
MFRKIILARIFHTDSAAACEHLMDTASASNCSSGSVYAHSRRQTSSLALPHQPSRLPRYDQHEISGLRSLYSVTNISTFTYVSKETRINDPSIRNISIISNRTTYSTCCICRCKKRRV